MNEIDGALSVLGPQLVKGKPVALTKAKKAALAAWSVKFALMLQLVYPRDSRFVIPEADYEQFYADRQPGDLMKLWAGYMEPPGKHGGPAFALHDHRHDSPADPDSRGHKTEPVPPDQLTRSPPRPAANAPLARRRTVGADLKCGPWCRQAATHHWPHIAASATPGSRPIAVTPAVVSHRARSPRHAG